MDELVVDDFIHTIADDSEIPVEEDASGSDDDDNKVLHLSGIIVMEANYRSLTWLYLALLLHFSCCKLLCWFLQPVVTKKKKNKRKFGGVVSEEFNESFSFDVVSIFTVMFWICVLMQNVKR